MPVHRSNTFFCETTTIPRVREKVPEDLSTNLGIGFAVDMRCQALVGCAMSIKKAVCVSAAAPPAHSTPVQG